MSQSARLRQIRFAVLRRLHPFAPSRFQLHRHGLGNGSNQRWINRVGAKACCEANARVTVAVLGSSDLNRTESISFDRETRRKSVAGAIRLSRLSMVPWENALAFITPSIARRSNL
jgi:hypothetical protein